MTGPLASTLINFLAHLIDDNSIDPKAPFSSPIEAKSLVVDKITAFDHDSL